MGNKIVIDVMFIFKCIAFAVISGTTFYAIDKYVEARAVEKANVFIQGYEAELYKNPYFQQARQLTMKAIEEQNKKAQQEKK